MTKGGHISRSQETRIRFWMWVIFAALMLPFTVVKGWQEYADRTWGDQARWRAITDANLAVQSAMADLYGKPRAEAEAKLLAAFPRLQPDVIDLRRLQSSEHGFSGRTFFDPKFGNAFSFRYSNGLVDSITTSYPPAPPGPRPPVYELIEHLRRVLEPGVQVCWFCLLLISLVLMFTPRTGGFIAVRRVLADLLCMTFLCGCLTLTLGPGNLPPCCLGHGAVQFGVAILLFLLTIGLALLAHRCKATENLPLGRCQRCGYNLTGNVSGICPECGTPVPAELRTAPQIETKHEMSS